MKKLLLAALFAIGFINPSHSAILARCAEGIGCNIIGGATFVSTAGAFNATFSRGAWENPAVVATTYPAPTRIELPFPAASGFWFSGTYQIANSSAVTGAIFVEIADANGVVRLVLRTTTGGWPNMVLSSRNAAGTLTDLTNFTTCGTLVLCKLDVSVQYGTAITIYSNSAQVGQYLGDPRTDGATQLARVDYSGPMASVSGQARWSEMFVADADTRSQHMLTCLPQAAGTPQNWTGSLANITDIQADLTYNTSATASQRSNWTLCSLPATASTPVNVTTCARIARGSSGPQNFRHTLQIAGGNYDSPADINPTVGFVDSCYNWGGNSPASGLPWATSDFTGMQSGVISQP